jgi:hypothetical protein
LIYVPLSFATIRPLRHKHAAAVQPAYFVSALALALRIKENPNLSAICVSGRVRQSPNSLRAPHPPPPSPHLWLMHVTLICWPTCG